MKAIVLAGGEGTRLRPLTWTTPKPLLPIVNRPFLEHQLAWLAGHGVTEVVLSLGYRSDAFAGRSFSDLPLQVAAEPEPLGTAGAIRFAAEAGGVTSRFLVCNGDVLTDLDVSALVRFHEEREAEATIALTRVDDPSAFGVVPTDTDGRVLRFVEKPPPGEAPTDWINAGTYVLEPSVLDDIPSGRAVSIERETFPGLLDRSGRLYALRSSAYWLDIGTPAKYLEANADRLQRGGGASLVGPGAVVAPGAAVDGSVLGSGVVVEAGAKVLRSVLFDGARVGAGAEVTDSVLGAGAAVEAGAAVSGVSIVGPGAVVPAGERLTGARVEAPGSPGSAP
ncbi:MAG TPA: NDP-sugar synthase [Acidimicrobiia bacterium]|nr:NDP-sugar synthase [Acidimicrobiia bacterium]